MIIAFICFMAFFLSFCALLIFSEDRSEARKIEAVIKLKQLEVERLRLERALEDELDEERVLLDALSELDEELREHRETAPSRSRDPR